MKVALTFAFLAPLFAEEAPVAPAGSGPFGFVMMIFVFLVAMYLLFILPTKSRDKQMNKMLDSLKVNDRVLTTGGVIGTVFSIDREAGEVVLRVDDSANVKVRFALSSIYFVFDKEAAKKAAKEKEKEKDKAKTK
ncbi:MAG: preprotein translocase subunit YajC [Thermoguttaceae bacterium]|nr:preprotein translocase subunit YajC [Thermoguttaceae bacterium]